eukprot:2479864-Prymnesium_polylepis.1
MWPAEAPVRSIARVDVDATAALAHSGVAELADAHGLLLWQPACGSVACDQLGRPEAGLGAVLHVLLDLEAGPCRSALSGSRRREPPGRTVFARFLADYGASTPRDRSYASRASFTIDAEACSVGVACAFRGGGETQGERTWPRRVGVLAWGRLPAGHPHRSPPSPIPSSGIDATTLLKGSSMFERILALVPVPAGGHSTVTVNSPTSSSTTCPSRAAVRFAEPTACPATLSTKFCRCSFPATVDLNVASTISDGESIVVTVTTPRSMSNGTEPRYRPLLMYSTGRGTTAVPS